MRPIEHSESKDLGSFGILNRDAIREVLSRVTPLDHANVRLVCRSFSLFGKEVRVRQRMSQNIFPWLIENFAESFSKLQLVDPKELRDFLMSDLAISQKIIGLNNLVNLIASGDREYFPAEYFAKTLAKTDKIFVEMKLSRKGISRNDFAHTREFFIALNLYLIEAFRLSLENPSRDVTAFLSDQVTSLMGEIYGFDDLLKPYLSGEKRTLSKNGNGLESRASNLSRDFMTDYLRTTDSDLSCYLGKPCKIFGALLFLGMLVGGGVLVGLFPLSKGESSAAAWSFGITMMTFGAGVPLVIALGAYYAWRTATRQFHEQLTNNNADVVLQIEPATPAPATERTPLLAATAPAVKSVNNNENSDVEMQRDEAQEVPSFHK